MCLVLICCLGACSDFGLVWVELFGCGLWWSWCSDLLLFTCRSRVGWSSWIGCLFDLILFDCCCVVYSLFVSLFSLWLVVCCWCLRVGICCFIVGLPFGLFPCCLFVAVVTLLILVWIMMLLVIWLLLVGCVLVDFWLACSSGAILVAVGLRYAGFGVLLGLFCSGC